jgi:tetratricopeptide (TPR) repeat protein
LKGISTPIEVYQVIRESGVRSRFDVAVTKGLTPLVGREQEVGLLLEHWEQAKEGRGQVVLLCGEPGIGKSRLVQVLKEQLSRETHVRIESRCSPYYQNSAFYPVIDHLQRLLFRREDSSEEKLGKLERALVGAQYFKSAPTEAETCFRQAIDIARSQSAKSLELRSVMSLSRLWQKQGKKEKARQMLAEIYGWFTEGFDTCDLKEAKILLDELS